ncbi:MAG: hypothetical protein HYZ22_02160 [Chloroflexi bacterium]|nr:hypothetical protein [Chloroflexota bacterium]
MSMLLKGRLAGFQRAKLNYLLDMLYTPSELAEELGITVRQFYRVYIPLGCPTVRDRAPGRIYIHGLSFAEWYFSTYPLLSMGVDEGFCLTCKKPVPMLDSVLKQSGGLSYYVFKCPKCKRKISRIVSNEK